MCYGTSITLRSTRQVAPVCSVSLSSGTLHAAALFQLDVDTLEGQRHHHADRPRPVRARQRRQKRRARVGRTRSGGRAQQMANTQRVRPCRCAAQFFRHLLAYAARRSTCPPCAASSKARWPCVAEPFGHHHREYRPLARRARESCRLLVQVIGNLGDKDGMRSAEMPHAGNPAA